MAFNPRTGLVYIPAQEIANGVTSVKDFKPAPIGWNLGVDVAGIRPNVKGYLIAWDPVKQKEVWRANYLGPWNGGMLTTAGNLVVQGNAAGDFSCLSRRYRRKAVVDVCPVAGDGGADHL